MSNEKRQMRLLPFRLRRSGAPRYTADHLSEDAGADAELSAMLRKWNAPQPETQAARARLLKDFRAVVARPPLWRRAMTASIRVPLPIAACALVAMLASLAAVAARTFAPLNAQTTPRALSTAPVVRVVEVPVVHEKVVTRVVYMEKRESIESLGAPASVSNEGEVVTIGARAAKPTLGPRDAVEPASFVTRVDMDDFQPADEVKIRVIKKGNGIEK